jgi:hypothetical protein
LLCLKLIIKKEVPLKAQIIFALSYLFAVFISMAGIIKIDMTHQISAYWYQSVLVFIDKEKVPGWLYYPMQCINLSEILYIFLLSFGLTQVLNIKYLKSTKFVGLYYGLGLLFWLVFATFINITIYE